MAKNNIAIQEDIQLADRILSGDITAFEQLYNDNHKRIYGNCLKLMGDAELAEDQCQETFLKAWRKISQYKGNAKLATWLFRISINECWMYYRKKSNKLEKLSIEDEDVRTLVEEKTKLPFMHVILNPELNKVIAQLPPGYKNCIILKEIMGYEHSEVGKILGWSEGTSKSQVFKAKLALQKLIQKKVNPTVLPNLVDSFA